MRIKGKRVLVTGGAVRVGQALCRAFAAAGAQVVIHYRNSGLEAEELRNSLPGAGHEIVECDLSVPEQAAGLLENCGRVDILVNNAAVYFLDEADARAREQIQVNYLSPLCLMEQFIAQGLDEGCIINFLDQEVADTSEPASSYSYSKRALRDATMTAALAAAPQVRVNAVAPGPVLPPVGLNAPGMQKVLKKVPLGKQTALDEICESCLFLVRNDALTGQIIYADGGQHLNYNTLQGR